MYFHVLPLPLNNKNSKYHFDLIVYLSKRDKNSAKKKQQQRTDPIITNDRCICVNVLVLVVLCYIDPLHRIPKNASSLTLQCSAVIEDGASEHTLLETRHSCEKRNKNNKQNILLVCYFSSVDPTPLLLVILILRSKS